MIKSETMDIKISDKIFYDRFPFKIVVQGNSWNHDATRLEELNDYIHSHIEYPWMEMQQVQRNNLSIYLKKMDMVQGIMDFFEDIIVEIHAPYSEEVLSEMKKGVVDVREKLYFNKYRYRIECGKSYGVDDSKLHATLDKIKKPGINRVYHSKSGWTSIVYTNEKHDLAKLRLTLNKNLINNMTECKLYTEI